MNIFFGICLLFLTANAHADQTLKYFKNDKYEQMKIKTFQKANLNDACFKAGKPNCKAWTVFSGSPKERTKSKTPLAGNPAANYCWDVGAKKQNS